MAASTLARVSGRTLRVGSSLTIRDTSPADTPASLATSASRAGFLAEALIDSPVSARWCDGRTGRRVRCGAPRLALERYVDEDSRGVLRGRPRDHEAHPVAE